VAETSKPLGLGESEWDIAVVVNKREVRYESQEEKSKDLKYSPAAQERRRP
jgi:hypothetical protein